MDIPSAGWGFPFPGELLPLLQKANTFQSGERLNQGSYSGLHLKFDYEDIIEKE